jgi:hypothetical protein
VETQVSGHHHTARGPIDDQILVEESHADGFIGHLGAPGNRMPETGERLPLSRGERARVGHLGGVVMALDVRVNGCRGSSRLVHRASLPCDPLLMFVCPSGPFLPDARLTAC